MWELAEFFSYLFIVVKLKGLHEIMKRFVVSSFSHSS